MCPESTTLTKVCTRCGVEKPATAEFFHRRADSRDSLRNHCKECRAEYKRLYRQNHHEAALEWNRRYRRNHPEAVVETRHRYTQTNREAIVEHKRLHRRDNQDYYRAYDCNRRARKKSSPGTHTAADVAAQRTRQKGRCYWCGEKVGRHYHVDHVTPLALGGSNGPENLVIACPHCNLKKHDKHPMDFAGIMF